MKDIRQFTELYHSNHFLLTCRIAAQEYTFENFTEVEIADFDDQQIAVFATKWFAQKDPTKTERFLRKLRDNSRVKELATNPLLLTLLCLGFEEANYLDPSRSGLYKEGLDVLLKKWDAKRSIERGEIYKNLKLERKKELLSQLAHNTFLPGNYFFKQELAEAEIRNYIVNLPESPNDPRQLDLDSEEVLGAIVAQHGLLIPRASDIYSFSHLTFHEYFTARHIVSSLNLENVLTELTEHLYENRWREVFILATEMLVKADPLLLKIKEKIGSLIIKDTQLQDFLFWVEAKAAEVSAPYKRAAIRAYYFSSGLAHNLDSTLVFPLGLTSDNDITTVPTYILDLFGFARDLARNLDKDLDRDLDSEFDSSPSLDRALDVTLDIAGTLNIASTKNMENSYILIFNLAHVLDSNLVATRMLAQKFDCYQLKEVLQQLHEDLLDIDVSINGKEIIKWWQSNGKAWIKKFRNAMINYRNLGHNWEFGDAQKKLLEQYLRANQLLVDCLNGECYVTRSVREEIENTLLLPAADLDK